MTREVAALIAQMPFILYALLSLAVVIAVPHSQWNLLAVAAPYFLGPTISKRYTTLRDATGVSASSARTCGSKASKLVVFARRGGYCGGESEASARSTVFFAQPTSLAILRIDNPCPRRYRICAHCSKEITHPIFFGWATFRGAFWATFQRALTRAAMLQDKGVA